MVSEMPMPHSPRNSPEGLINAEGIIEKIITQNIGCYEL